MPIAEEGLDFVRQQEILLKSFLLMTGHATERTENNNTTQVELTVEEKIEEREEKTKGVAI